MTHQEVEILLVEDNPDDLELSLRALRAEQLGNHIQVARDGEEALDFLLCRGQFSGRSPAQQPRLVLLDLKLPKIDGLQVLAELKRNESTRAIPVVMLTSSDLETDLIRSYQLGVNSYLQKPVDFGEFCKVVKQVGLYWLVVNKTAGSHAPLASSRGAA